MTRFRLDCGRDAMKMKELTENKTSHVRCESTGALNWLVRDTFVKTVTNLPVPKQQ
jgi:hypothetical protein